MNRFYVKMVCLLMAVAVLAGGGVLGCAQKPTAPATPEKEVAPPTQVFKWRCQAYLPPITVSTTEMAKVCDQLRQETNGQLDITMYYVDSIFPTSEMTEACNKGAIEMVYTSPSVDAGKYPVLEFVYNIPGFDFDVPNIVTLTACYGLEDVVKEEIAKQTNLRYYSTHAYPQVLTSKKAIYGMSDFKGLKIRAGGALADWFTELGAATVYIPGSELYTAMSTGIIDGMCYGGYEAPALLSLWEVADYLIEPYVGVGNSDCLYINKDAFNSLPEDLQGLLDARMKGLYFTLSRMSGMEAEAKYRDGILSTNKMMRCYIPKDEQTKMSKLGLEVMQKRVVDEVTTKAFDCILAELYDKQSVTGATVPQGYTGK